MIGGVLTGFALVGRSQCPQSKNTDDGAIDGDVKYILDGICFGAYPVMCVEVTAFPVGIPVGYVG